MQTLDFPLYNAILFSLVPIIYYLKFRRLDLFLFISLIYGITSILCCRYAFDLNKAWHFELSGFIYLFFVFLLFIWPFYGIDFSKKTISIIDEKNLGIQIILYIYIISTALSLYYTIPTANEILSGGEFNELRQNVYHNPSAVKLYSSFTERMAKNISSYLSPVGLIFSFYLLIKKNKTKFDICLTIILFVCIIGQSFLNATLVASRGMIMFLCFNLITMYIIFKKQISPKVKRILYLSFSGILLIFLSYTLAVTYSRFGEGRQASDSIIKYFSHSMLYFNDGVYNSIHTYLNGKYFFSWFFGDKLNMTSLGLTHGSAFVTFIGCLFWDFGPIGTIVIAVISSFIIRKLLLSKKLRLSSLIIIIFYFNYILNGVFVTGPSTGLKLIMTIIIYMIIRFLENNKVSLK